MVWRAPDVDQVGGSLVDDERSMLPGYLAYQRSVLLRRCAGLTGAELARRAVPPSSLSLLGLLRHLAKVERRWFRERFAGEIRNVRINGVDVGPLVEAELNRRHPERTKLSPTDLTLGTGRSPEARTTRARNDRRASPRRVRSRGSRRARSRRTW
jgi:hypothetical protein